MKTHRFPTLILAVLALLALGRASTLAATADKPTVGLTWTYAVDLVVACLGEPCTDPNNLAVIGVVEEFVTGKDDILTFSSDGLSGSLLFSGKAKARLVMIPYNDFPASGFPDVGTFILGKNLFTQYEVYAAGDLQVGFDYTFTVKSDGSLVTDGQREYAFAGGSLRHVNTKEDGTFFSIWILNNNTPVKYVLKYPVRNWAIDWTP